MEQPNVQAPAADNYNGVTLNVNVKFEPNTITEVRAVLRLNSPDGIEYTCLLYGYGTAPQPQGPVKIAAGKPVGIEFKNPLSEKAEFMVNFDNSCFSLTAKLGAPLEVCYFKGYI